MRIEQATKRIESLADLQPKPETWEAAMQALIAGAIDYDDIEPLLVACAEAADSGLPETSLWAWSGDEVNGMIRDAQRGNVLDRAPYVRMGQAADEAQTAGAVS